MSNLSREEARRLDSYITREPPEMDPEEERALDEFEDAWLRLKACIPTIQHKTKRGQLEPVQEVRIILRRKRGQWLAQVGSVSRTGSSEGEALGKVVDILEAQQADQIRRASEA